MNSSESKVKKLWLFFFIVVAATNLITAMLFSLAHFLIFLFLFTGTFYCSYLKTGTKMLNLYIFSLIYPIYKSFGNALHEKKIVQTGNLGIEDVVIAVFSFLATCISVWLSFRLKKMNQIKNESRILSNSEYNNIINAIKAAKDKNELDHHYQEGLTKAPQIQKLIKKTFTEARDNMGANYYL